MSKRRSKPATQPAKRRRTIINRLESDLTPQMLSPTQTTDGPRSRYGRKIFTSPIVSTTPQVNKRKVYQIFSIHNVRLNPLLRLVLHHSPRAIDTSPIAKLLTMNKKQMKNRSQDNAQADNTQTAQFNDFNVSCDSRDIDAEKAIPAHYISIDGNEIIDLTEDDSNMNAANTNDDSQETSHENITSDDAIDMNECEMETAQPIETDSPRIISLEISLVDNDSQIDEGIGYNSEVATSISTAGTEIDDNSQCSTELGWHAGDLVWAALGLHPFWPAIVSNHISDEQQLFKDSTKVHVVFLYDNGRTAWVNAKTSIIAFEGLDNFAELCKQRENKRSKLYKKPKTKSWEFAVLEADVLRHINAADRNEFYKVVLLDSVLATTQKLKTNRRSGSDRCYTPQTFDTAYSSIQQSSSRTSMSPSMNEIDTNYDIQQNIDYYLESVQSVLDIEPIDDDGIETPSLHSTDTMSLFYCPLAEFIQYRLLRHPQYDAAIKCRTDFQKSLWAMCKELTKPTMQKHASTTELAVKHSRCMSIDSKMSTESTDSQIKQTKRQRSLIINKMKQAVVANKRRSASNELQVQKQKIRGEMREKSKMERVRNDFEIIRKCDMDIHPANYLFKNVPKEAVCEVCFEEGSVSQCAGQCFGHFHKDCINNSLTEENVLKLLRSRTKVNEKNRPSISGELETNSTDMCRNCSAKDTMKCFICKKDDIDCIECCEKNCSRNYHEHCLQKFFPQYKITYINKVKKFTCPQHICHTCISADIKNFFEKPESDRKLIKCLLCPGTYHRASKCIPAGSEILSEEQLVCGRHHTLKVAKRINVDFCMLCSGVGELICCDTCPHAFHEACLKISVDDDLYVCEECESGKKPLYGEVVWVNYVRSSWWPAIIVPPPIIPETVLAAKREPQYLCVLYFGTHNYGWVGQSQVYCYQEGDAAFKMKNEKKQLEFAIDEAEKCIKEKTQKSSTVRIFKPKPYKKIKTNRITAKFPFADDSEKENICSCTATDVSPCGIDSNCVNQLLFVECDPATCPAKEKCLNQFFKSGPRYDFEIRLTSERGFGLFAKEKIPYQAFIIEYVGEVIDQNEFNLRFERAKASKEGNFYFLTLGHTFYIDAGPYGNDARFINHSCEPNSATKKWNVDGQTRIGFFAERDIYPGDEITFFYNWGIKEQMCRCGSTKCRGFM